MEAKGGALTDLAVESNGQRPDFGPDLSEKHPPCRRCRTNFLAAFRQQNATKIRYPELKTDYSQATYISLLEVPTL